MNLSRSVRVPIVGLALACAALVGCSPTPVPTPTPTPAFASEEEAFAAAEETYRAYMDASNSVDLQDPRSFDALDQYTAGDYQAQERKGLSEMHAEGYISGGAIRIESFRGIAVTSSGRVHAVACNDVSETLLTDSEGKSLVSPDRHVRYALDLTFEQVDSRLLLIDSDAVEDDSCLAE